ncbi:MAG: hypothetical protein VXW30_03035 [Candidatus Thermoplasmatota archaeon]|nr:hypothetical protein [Candidatus Thermoplasmatota archaeon]MEC9118236.1 hypothetical protein [Candidatus Thermoplasmatota archaeon]
MRDMSIEDGSNWGSDGLDDSWGPPIPPPPAEMPPPPPPVGDSNLSRTKGSAPPPPMPPPASAPQPVTPVAVDPSPMPVMQHSQQMPKEPSIFSKIFNEIDIKSIFDKATSAKVVISTIIGLGFLMLILSESYANSANYTNAPDAPDTIDSADFDIDNNGLNSSESDNYADALRQYSDDVDEYLNQLDEHNDLMNTYTGKSVFWSNISSAFIVGGLVCLTFSPKAIEMSNAVRLTLVIGTIYMLAGMLGYDMPGVDAAVGFGFGGN